MDSEVFLLLMLVGVFAGFVDSAVGGGGLLRLPAMLSAGLPPHVALGTNKFASAAAAAIASVKYLQSGIVPRKAAFIGCSLMVLFSIIGASVVLSISADAVLGIVVIVLSALFLYVLFNPQFGKEEEIEEDVEEVDGEESEEEAGVESTEDTEDGDNDNSESDD